MQLDKVIFSLKDYFVPLYQWHCGCSIELKLDFRVAHSKSSAGRLVMLLHGMQHVYKATKHHLRPKLWFISCIFDHISMILTVILCSVTFEKACCRNILIFHIPGPALEAFGICPLLPFSSPASHPTSCREKVTADSWANIHSNSHYTMSPLGNNTMAVFVKKQKQNVHPFLLSSRATVETWRGWEGG